jgi:hypothetical protein
MSRKKPRPGHRWAKRADFYVTRRWEYGQCWNIVRVKGRMGVWLGVYSTERGAYRAIDTAVHQRSVDVPDTNIAHTLFTEAALPSGDETPPPPATEAK